MFQKFGFNLKQAIFNVKRSFMTILTLTLAISMIAGLFYYFDAFEREASRSASQFGSFTDLNLPHVSAYNQLDCSNIFQFTDPGVQSSLAETQLEIESYYKYQLFMPSSSSTFVFADHSDRPDLISQGLDSFQLFHFSSYLLEDSFYKSERFSQFFQLMEGRTPQNKSEVIIDMMLGAKMDYRVGSTVNITTLYTPNHSDYYNFNITDITIVGIFVPTTSLPTYTILNRTLQYNNYFYGYTSEQISELQYENLYGIETWGSFTPILGYSTFENDDHPFQIYYQDLATAFGINFRDLYHFSGYGVTLTREFTSFFSIKSPEQTIETGLESLYRTLPNSVIVLDLFSAPLQQLYELSNRMRIISQLINIPIIIVAIIVGSFTSKSSTQNKIDEYLIMRSKGVSNRLIRRQIFMESFINGIVASILGVGFGALTFYGHGLWVQPLIYSYIINVHVTLFVKWSSVLISLGIGIFISLFTSISSMVYITKLKNSELLTTIEQQDMDIEFDEQSVYASKRAKEARKEIRELKKEYRNAVQEKRQKVAKWSILYIFIGILPIYYYIFMIIGSKYISNLWFLNWQDISQNFLIYGLFTLIFIVTPILLSIAFIRIIAIEAPVLMARFSRFFGRMFLGDKSYLLGLQMMKKKRYATVFMFLGIFSAVFVHLNIMNYSFNAQQNVYENYEIGSDLSVWFNYGTNLTNSADFENLTQELKSISLNGTNIIDNAMITYHHLNPHINFQYSHYVNFSIYLDFVSGKKKILPDKDFISTIEGLIDYNQNDPERDVYPAAIVNQKYLDNNNLHVGNITYVNYDYYNSSEPWWTAFDNGFLIPVRIVGTTEYMPGVYVRPVTEEYDYGEGDPPTIENIVIDIGDLPFQGEDTILHAEKLHVLINLNDEVELNNEKIQDSIISHTEDLFGEFGIGEFQFYNYNWVSMRELDSSMESVPLLVYKIGYFVFIVVLIQVALGVPILLTSVHRKDEHFYGLLMARGFGKKGIFRFILGELFVVYFLAILSGVAVGLLSSTLTMLVGRIMNPYAIGQQFRLFVNPLDLLIILGSAVGISLLVFLVEFLFSTRKSISEYLSKF